MPKRNKYSSNTLSECSSDVSDVCSSDQTCASSQTESRDCNQSHLSAVEIAEKYADAVVGIQSEFILLGTGAAGFTGITGGTPLAPDVRTDVILEGNGFFIRGHYIVAPAHLVLLPPSLSSVVNRYPYYDPNELELGVMRDEMVRASRILVNVYNVNGEPHSFVYEADLLGVDGAGDIAVLSINYKKHWNLCNPCIEPCHPYLNFGSSRSVCKGEKAYLLGDYVSNSLFPRQINSAGCISEGLVSDYRYADYSGFASAEFVVVSAPAYTYSSGLPILDSCGRVIAMQVSDIASTVEPVPVATGATGNAFLSQRLGSGLVGGVSEFFMRRIIKCIIRGSCSRKYNHHLERICDPAGPFYRYRKGYLGIAYNIFNGVDYDITTDFTSGSATSGRPRIRLAPNGEFLSAPKCKEILGIKVIGVAGANPTDANGVPNGYFYVPGGTGAGPLPEWLQPSPVLGRINPGDLITHIEGHRLGDLKLQIAPGVVTWRLCAGDQLDISYRRGGNALNTADNAFTENYDNLHSISVCVNEFPAFLDYPWYAVNIFPLLATTPYPGFSFPPGQLVNPQLPMLTTGAMFYPSF